jgi:hypothetical protein
MMTILGATLGLTAGCGPGAREQRLRSDLTDDICVDAEVQPLLAGLNPADEADALAWRTSNYSPREKPEDIDEDEWEEQVQQEIEAAAESLVVKETAGDCDSIESCPLLPLPSEAGIFVSDGPGYAESHHLVAYRGDETQLYYTEQEIRAFLGTIDTEQEARFLLILDGYRIPCDGDNNFKEDGSDYVFYTETGHTCGGDVTGHLMRVSADGELSEDDAGVVERGDKNCAIGRLPHGLCEQSVRSTQSELGEYMAQVAYLEAASVAAFYDLEAELRSYGAPVDLRARAARAAREESRHAIHCRALSRKWGGTNQVPEVRRGEPRSRFQMACDNAREGLTREAFGALIAQHQALCAADPQVRTIMESIAEDELGHAEFSLALHHYLMESLSAVERAEVELVRQDAVSSFAKSLLRDESAAVREQLGLPDRKTAQLLFTRLFAQDELFQA